MCSMDDSTLVTYKTSIGEVQYWSRKYEEAHRESILKLPEKFLCRQRKLVKRDLRIIMNKPYSKQPPPMLTIDLTRLDFDAQSRIMPVLKCFQVSPDKLATGIGPYIVCCCPLPRWDVDTMSFHPFHEQQFPPLRWCDVKIEPRLC